MEPPAERTTALSPSPWEQPEPEMWRPPPPTRHRHRGRRGGGNGYAIAGAVGVVLLFAIAAAIVLWPSGSETPPATDPATGVAPSAGASAADDSRTQAEAINTLLDDMAGSRSELARAMTDAQRCSGLEGAIPTLQKVVEDRERQLGEAEGLAVGALAEGERLKSALTRSLRASLDADRAYVRWAEAERGCTGATPANAHLARGGRLSTGEATPAKREFLELWAPIAREQGQPPRNEDQI
ncbi:hypothetical protein DPM19_30350 [Actinomadura craniellae]|uniref:Uncharacterized protein n=2 Tax=Actinomadura craniellae TaxID=2231787 RepID=A0A365GWX1_9ACTN|nr:hypothetical protein DPM19_30350 [Actinomadura craniellae]